MLYPSLAPNERDCGSLGNSRCKCLVDGLWWCESEKQGRRALWSVAYRYRYTGDYPLAMTDGNDRATSARKFKCCDCQHK